MKRTFLHKVFYLACISYMIPSSYVCAFGGTTIGNPDVTKIGYKITEWNSEGEIDRNAYLVKVMPKDLRGSVGTMVSNGFTVSTLTPVLEVSPSSLDFDSHYVTKELDEGPIIEQDTVTISHRDSLEDLVRKGEDLEKVVLSRAVRLALQKKILSYGNKTVVFD